MACENTNLAYYEQMHFVLLRGDCLNIRQSSTFEFNLSQTFSCIS